jgi:hypothetical protein
MSRLYASCDPIGALVDDKNSFYSRKISYIKDVAFVNIFLSSTCTKQLNMYEH